MNGVKLISKGSGVVSDLPQSTWLYFYLVSDISIGDESVFSAFTVQSVQRNLKQVSADSLNELVSLGYIKVSESGVIYLGEVVDEEPVLFVNMSREDSLEDIFSELQPLALQYEKDAKKMGRINKAEKCIDSLKVLQGKAIGSYTEANFRSLFAAIYELLYQEPYRMFDGKDFGLFKYLYKMYDKAVLARMIHYFLNNYASFSKSKALPEIGYLVHNKDAIFSQVSGKKKIVTASKNRFK